MHMAVVHFIRFIGLCHHDCYVSNLVLHYCKFTQLELVAHVWDKAQEAYDNGFAMMYISIWIYCCHINML